MLKRCVSIIVIIMMLLISPADVSPVFAASQAAPWDGTVDISWYDPNAAVYDISTPAQLAGLAALVNGMTDPNCPKVIGNAAYLKSVRRDNVTLVGAGGGNVSDTVYASNIDFAYKTVRLTADLDMGGVYNQTNKTWSGPNWSPIGGKFPMKPGEVKGDCLVLDTRFNGVFDGQGHTVKNIYCDRYAAKGFPYSMAIGLVGYLGGASDLEQDAILTFDNGWTPTVRNVIVGKGSIYGRRMVGGVVGRVGETNNGVVIENCANFSDVKNTDSKGVGGVCGSGWGAGVIRSCYNVGSVTTTFSCPAGGICGSNGGMDIYNCYSIGRINSNGEKMGRGIGGHDSGSYTVGNCYYLAGSDDDPLSGGYYKGSSTRVTVNVAKLSGDEMKNSAFLDRLNVSGSVFTADSAGINNGFPVLWYQVKASTASCTVTVQNPASGGTVEADKQTVVLGQAVNFKAKATAGWILDHYTVNGKAIDTDFYTVAGDITVSAVFSQVRSAKISIPENMDFYLAVARTGYKLSGGQMVWVSGENLSDGDTVLQGNTLKLLAHGYEDASPADTNYEYTDAFNFTAENTVKNADGTYLVTGNGNIKITAERGLRPKSWISLADTSWYDPSHPVKSYTLTTAAQLAGLSHLVNIEGVTFSGQTILLGNNISLENIDGTTGVRTWAAAGVSMSRSFQGAFDGQGNTISDMTAWNDGSYSGLFGCCVNASIKNVRVIGTVKGEASASYAAGIAAFASGCTIENCAADADITADGTHAGGIVAEISDGAAVKNCFSYGKVSGISGVGGIVGVSSTGTDSIVGCANFGDVRASGSDTYGVGGIAGRLAGKIDSCVNKGAVTGADRYTGGLAGYATTRYTSVITLSQNTGAVYSNADNANAAIGGLVGYAQYLSCGGCSNKGAAKIGSSFVSPSKGELIGKAGDVKEITIAGAIPEYNPAPPTVQAQSAGSFVVTFIAQGKGISAVNCDAGTKTVAEPAIPAVEGCTASWTKYQLNDRDITVKAIYRQNLIRSGESITASGTYFIPWFASGEIDIASGLDVTLKGVDGEEAGFENLVITAGDNTVLTLDDVKTSGPTTLLKLGKDDTVILKGDNALNGNSDAKNNEQPTVTVQGDLTVQGDGALKISAMANNAAVLVAPGSVIVQNSGSLTINKKDMLGFAGGAFYAAGSKVLIKGGRFSGHTNSDNVAILSADELTISGGTVRVQAERSPQTLVSLKTVISGGTVMSVGHSGNSSPEKRCYYSEQSIPNLSAAAGVFKKSALPFTDVYVDSEYYDAVVYCVNKNYFSGTGATTFSPDGSMTRAMFASVLYRMAGSPAVSGSVPFTDLSQGWYKKAVIWAVQSGITSGTGASTFSPDASVTREQAALFLSRYAKIKGKNFTESTSELADPHVNASRGLLAMELMRFDAAK